MTTRIIVAATATVLAFPALGMTSAYADAGANGDNGSACGQAHAARADVNGNFGYLGEEGGTPGAHNGVRGQDPDATGYNNSHTSCHS